METPISQTMDLVNGKAEYDAQAKLLLSHKVILAKIIKMLIPEFADVPEKDIYEKYIQDGVKVGVVAADPDVKDLLQTKVGYRILPLSQESSEVKSGKIYFDIVFAVSDPSIDKQLTHIYINLEQQLTYKPGYSVSTRAIYYLCRMISM